VGRTSGNVELGLGWSERRPSYSGGSGRRTVGKPIMVELTMGREGVGNFGGKVVLNVKCSSRVLLVSSQL
jgi:hypothetical protein